MASRDSSPSPKRRRRRDSSPESNQMRQPRPLWRATLHGLHKAMPAAKKCQAEWATFVKQADMHLRVVDEAIQREFGQSPQTDISETQVFHVFQREIGGAIEKLLKYCLGHARGTYYSHDLLMLKDKLFSLKTPAIVATLERRFSRSEERELDQHLTAIGYGEKQYQLANVTPTIYFAWEDVLPKFCGLLADLIRENGWIDSSETNTTELNIT
eukprot:TRINITY_DN93444_c0_g1_i1.p1 TRINITY_DN93444_c0_g1~~TRINITY_DN93444_c0_g1_i1.p1  ORF type:complete len:213 (+),score=25.52 TRINITY_DN93444_c0_g1_i1:105-743(+)